MIKKAIELYFKTQREKKRQSAYELGKTFFGVHDSSSHNLSTTYKQKLKEKLSGKNLLRT